MPRLILLAVFLPAVFSPVYGQEGWQGELGFPNYGVFSVYQPSVDADIEIDVSPSVKAFNFEQRPKEDRIHNFSAGFLYKDNGRLQATAWKGRYILQVPLVKDLLKNEALAALAMMNANYFSQDRFPRFKHWQFLYGISEYVSLGLGAPEFYFRFKAGGEAVTATISDQYGSISDWDNYGFGIKSEMRIPLYGDSYFRAETDWLNKKYNLEKYFFTERWTKEFLWKSELLIIPVEQFALIPSFNYKEADIEKDGRSDLERYELGGELILGNILPDASIIFKGVNSYWRHKKGVENLVAFGVYSEALSLEIYRKDTSDNYSAFTLEERLAGIKIGWKFGGKHQLKELDDYGYFPQRKYEFYRESGLHDDSKLSLSQQAEYLRTLRRRNEWSGNNLDYKRSSSIYSFRNVEEAYAGRGGDCDEQACLNSRLDELNGHKSVLFSWWADNKPAGHTAQLVKNDGQWYLDEYGMIYKINGATADTDLKTLMLEALKQNNRFIALPIDNGQGGDYESANCSQSGGYQTINSYRFSNFQSDKHRPNIEYGSELFTGRNFLFSH